MASELIITQKKAPIPHGIWMTLQGELNENTVASFRSTLWPATEDVELKTLILDLGLLHFMNSKGIGILVALHTHLVRAGKKLVLAAAQERVMDVMSLVGLTAVIPHFPTPQEAFQSLA